MTREKSFLNFPSVQRVQGVDFMGFGNLFKPKAEKELDRIIEEININLSNNYKSVAHEKRKRLGEAVEEFYSKGKLSEKKYIEYRRKYESYTELMKDYHH